MNRITFLCALSILGIQSSWGMAVGLFLPESIEKADIVAHIRIDEDVEIIPAWITSKTENGFTAFSSNPSEPEKYRKVATASLLHSFKAPNGIDKILIRHTNGFGCPNVRYTKGAEYIVFLQKEKDSEYYRTMNYYNGQFKIEEGQVVRFYLMPGYKYPEDLRMPYERVTAFLEELMQKQKG
jgi:hypothetical protein